MSADTTQEKVETVTETASVGTPAEQPKADEVDDTVRSGEKEVATNPDGLAQEKEKVEVKPVEKEVMPTFFVKKSDRIRIAVDVLTSKIDGRLMSVSKTDMGLDFVKDFGFMLHTVLWFEFSIPTYEDVTTYRQRSASFRREAQQVVVDKLQLRNFFLVWHLKDWNLPDAEGKKAELKHDENGSLSDESRAMVYSVPSTLLDVILTLFEKEVLLT